jgi:hypothetical protein
MITTNFYFSHLPDVWVRMGPSDGPNQPYVQVKNIFRNVALVNNIQKEFLLFTPVIISEGDKPETISYQYYGDPAYDWIVLLCNNITNVYDQWPLTSGELYNYVQRHYTDLDALNQIHHYESVEIKLGDIVVLEGGLEVNENFTYRNPQTGIWMTGESVRTSVTLYEHLVKENEKKKEIYLLKKTYLSQFIDEFDKLVAYDNVESEMDDIPFTRTSISENYI